MNVYIKALRAPFLPGSLIPVIIGAAAGWAYSARPLQLMSRGWGEICIFFTFGPFITLGAYYVMSGSLSGSAFALGLPHGFFIAAVIWINQFPDYEADCDVGKKNLVVRLGPKLSRYPYFISTCIQGDENSIERISLI
jgi:1,4-dihydroxy-2-naphthoate octaprenyltransferase